MDIVKSVAYFGIECSIVIWYLLFLINKTWTIGSHKKCNYYDYISGYLLNL